MALLIAVQGIAQQPSIDARRVFSTHDFTTTSGSPSGATEAWVDVKTPGHHFATDARTYMVGTIDVRDNTTNPTFSNALVDLPKPGWDSINVQTFQQVAIVQCRDAAESIQWQRYFYGRTTDASRWTNARAIAVWPADSDDETRVAICGETTDQEIPDSQLTSPLTSATSSDPTGYIAVYNGAGLLLWSFQFFSNDFTERCAITDLSIRVETDDEEDVTYDVVCAVPLGNAIRLARVHDADHLPAVVDSVV